MGPVNFSVVTGLLVALVAFSTSVEPAWAKTRGYILTGGELGDRALHFYTDDYIEAPGPHVREVSPPDSWPGAGYQLYDTWPFEAALQVAEGRPLAYLFPAERLVHNPASGLWLRLDDSIWHGVARWSGVQKALDAARSHPESLRLGPVAAALAGRGFEQARWDVQGPLPDGRSGASLSADVFPLDEFAASLRRPPLYEQPPEQALSHTISVRAPTEGGTWSAPGFMHYAPPTGDRGGRIWEGQSVASDASRVWESTPGFDARFGAALMGDSDPQGVVPPPQATAGPSGASSRVDEGSIAAVAAVLALGAIALLVARKRRGVRTRNV